MFLFSFFDSPLSFSFSEPAAMARMGRIGGKGKGKGKYVVVHNNYSDSDEEEREEREEREEQEEHDEQPPGGDRYPSEEDAGAEAAAAPTADAAAAGDGEAAAEAGTSHRRAGADEVRKKQNETKKALGVGVDLSLLRRLRGRMHPRSLFSGVPLLL